MKIKISTIRLSKSALAPLAKKLPGSDELQPACVFFCDTGMVWAEPCAHPTIASFPEDEDCGHCLHWPIDARIHRDVLVKTLRDLRPVFHRLLSWRDCSGGSDNAKDAYKEIRDTLRDAEDDFESLADVYDAAKWLQSLTLHDLWPEGRTLNEAVKWIQEQAKNNNVQLLGSVKDYLIELKKKEEL